MSEKSDPELPSKIRPLDQQLVNRIAAGEIIQRPFNALKELMENCLDAGSTSINIQIKEGGLKLIQIQDNGCGIDREDLTIVCERFTTSKLKEFDDLKTINTFGFRGEALASISHVSRLTIITRTKYSPCAYKGTYSEGKLTSDGIKPCASASRGTQITVEDLFYNSSLRKNALRNNSEEFHKIYEVVSKYSIHNYHVSFFLKRIGENTSDLKTTGCHSQTAKFRCEENEKFQLDTISLIYGTDLGKELQRLSIVFNDKLKFEMNGFISNSKYCSLKQTVFILFINERLVDCQPLKKAINNVAALYLPKNANYFIYINLKIDPKNLDVNIHPTKHEVRFLYQDEIVEQIQKCVEETMIGSNSSRACCAKNLTLDTFMDISTIKSNTTLDLNESNVQSPAGVKMLPYKMTRVDSKERKLDSFLHSSSLNDSKRDMVKIQSKLVQSDLLKSPLRNQHLPRDINLKSLNELRDSVEKKSSKNGRQILSDMTFVGVVNREMSLIQYQTELYLTNTKKLSEELFYQICLFNFGNFGYLKLEEPILLKELGLMGLESPEADWTPDDGPKDKLASRCGKFLYAKSSMLDDYFSIKIVKREDVDGNDEFYLETLPMLIENYEPDLIDLPVFIIRLATEVDWKDEKECFDNLSRQIAMFFASKNNLFSKIHSERQLSSQESSSSTSSSSSSFGNKEKPDENWISEHVLHTAFRTMLLLPVDLEKEVFFKLVDLSRLYRVFERC